MSDGRGQFGGPGVSSGRQSPSGAEAPDSLLHLDPEAIAQSGEIEDADDEPGHHHPVLAASACAVGEHRDADVLASSHGERPADRKADRAQSRHGDMRPGRWAPKDVAHGDLVA
jgi:hypothetical protein